MRHVVDTVCVSPRACILAALSSVWRSWWWWNLEEDSNGLKQWTESLGTSQWQHKKKSLEQVTYHVTLGLILGGSWSRTSPCTLPCQSLWWRWRKDNVLDEILTSYGVFIFLVSITSQPLDSGTSCFPLSTSSKQTQGQEGFMLPCCWTAAHDNSLRWGFSLKVCTRPCRVLVWD